MTPDMNPDLNPEVLGQIFVLCRKRLAAGRIWPEILEELEIMGYRPLDQKYVMRRMNAWVEQAKQLKADGWPYDDMVMYLVNLLATSPDIGRALLEAGLRPADMLRAALPEAISTGYQDAVIKMAMDCEKEADSIEECRRVVAWWLGAPPDSEGENPVGKGC